jgi:uncharacterized UBP type Zn finger protein
VIHIDYQSLREEEYYDISLTVKGMKNIYAAFEKWIEVELMDGENMYEAEGHGKQDAKMGKRFLSFPPVLHVHLNRFEYDFERDMSVKVNDRLEFPEALDLNKYIHVKNAAAEAEAAEAKAAEAEDAEPVNKLSSLVDYPDESEENPEAAPSEEQSAAEPPADEESRIDYDYVLHSVLIHGGDVHAGHYYVYVRHAHVGIRAERLAGSVCTLCRGAASRPFAETQRKGAATSERARGGDPNSPSVRRCSGGSVLVRRSSGSSASFWELCSSFRAVQAEATDSNQME